MSDNTTPLPPAPPAMPPGPPPAKQPRRFTAGAVKAIAATVAVASLVTTAVFTGLIWAQHSDTVAEYEGQHRLYTCASAHADPKTWGEDTDGLNCHELYDMSKKAWDDTYGVNHPANRPSDEDEDDTDSSTDTTGMTYEECLSDPDTTLADCKALSDAP
ncbi:hypothetical protein [Streptomyces sp. NPDC003036]|uniref:hypothetical protein n=1 Tax=Streptomyces sp. NPDC003036 TaxID=3154442 RepID=UPI0033A5687E